MLAHCFQSMVPATLPPLYRWVILFVILSFWIMVTWALMVMPAMATMPYPLWCLTWGMPVKVILSPTEYLGSVSLRRSTDLRIFASRFYSFFRRWNWNTTHGRTWMTPAMATGNPKSQKLLKGLPWILQINKILWKKLSSPKVCRDVMFVNFFWVQHLEICDVESLM